MAVGITIFVLCGFFAVIMRVVQKHVDDLTELKDDLLEGDQVRREQLRSYENALEFYADENNWAAPNNVLVELDIDKGFIARSTLERWGK